MAFDGIYGGDFKSCFFFDVLGSRWLTKRN